MLWDVPESGDRRVRHTKELAAHGYGRKRKGRGDAEVRRQTGAQRRVQVGRYRTYLVWDDADPRRAEQGTAGMLGTGY